MQIGNYHKPPPRVGDFTHTRTTEGLSGRQRTVASSSVLQKLLVQILGLSPELSRDPWPVIRKGRLPCGLAWAPVALWTTISHQTSSAIIAYAICLSLSLDEGTMTDRKWCPRISQVIVFSQHLCKTGVGFPWLLKSPSAALS